jgi:hypothetical protein
VVGRGGEKKGGGCDYIHIHTDFPSIDALPIIIIDKGQERALSWMSLGWWWWVDRTGTELLKLFLSQPDLNFKSK